MTALIETFWDRIGDVRAGMLAPEGERATPMAPQADRDANAIWFITAEGTAADTAAKSGAKTQFQVADAKANLYATIDGTLTEVHDEQKLDEMWNVFAAAWFENGREDSKVRLIKFTPQEGEIWATEKTVGYLYEIAKANLSDDTPDGGEHGRVTFPKAA
jgi:general stress protein 26